MRNTIVLYDSGVGGLPLLKPLIKIYSNTDFIYVGDSARAPYGTRNVSELLKINNEIISFLNNFNPNRLIIACNTSCALFYNHIQKALPYPTHSLIPPTALYFKNLKESSILVLGTPQTIKTKLYSKEINKISKQSNILELACPTWVPLIEKNISPYLIKKELLSLNKTISFKPDYIVLGCTHYPLWENYIQNIFPQSIIINPAIELINTLPSPQNESQDSQRNNITFYISGCKVSFNNHIQNYLNITSYKLRPYPSETIKTLKIPVSKNNTTH